MTRDQNGTMYSSRKNTLNNGMMMSNCDSRNNGGYSTVSLYITSWPRCRSTSNNWTLCFRAARMIASRRKSSQREWSSSQVPQSKNRIQTESESLPSQTNWTSCYCVSAETSLTDGITKKKTRWWRCSLFTLGAWSWTKRWNCVNLAAKAATPVVASLLHN